MLVNNGLENMDQLYNSDDWAPYTDGCPVVDGDTLRSEASAEKEFLMTQLREMLEQTSRKALLEADKDEAEFLQEKLQKVPYPIYIGQ